MNEILNFLVTQDRIQKISLKMFSATIFSIFVIWKNEKSKIIVDFKKINTQLYSNVYFLSRQNIILSVLNDFIVFSFVNLIKNFFQQDIKSVDWWKIIFVTFHRNQKWLTIFTMKFANIFDFFQHRIKKFLFSYFWQFVLIYIDDIIIYSVFLNQHVQHFDQVLILLKNNDVILALFKYHFVDFNIKILEHHVSRLELSTTKKKRNVIRRMKFLVNLKKLKIKLKIFDYYCNFVDHYAIIFKSLIKLKIKNFINNSIKNKFKREHAYKMRLREKIEENQSQFSSTLKTDDECRRVWKKLKKKFCSVFILIYSNFDLLFILYVNENKKKNFEIVLHQVEKNEIERFIFFLSRDLFDAKTKYWITKLKTNVLIWALIKLSQYFDDESFTMIIDYIALKFALQIKITNRKSIRFNEWFMYLSIYLSKMKIIHRAEKIHNNANDFFKIFIEIEIWYVDVYFIVVLSADQDFQIIIKKALLSNSHFERIYNKIRVQIKKTKKDENDSQTIY